MKHFFCPTVMIFLFVGNIYSQVATHIVISEVYGGGGNSGATWKNDFIELYNPTSSPVNLSGWSVQYASATGSSWQVTSLSGFIPPQGFFLIQEAQGSGGTTNLPTPDATGSTAIASAAGKIALCNTTAALSGTNSSGGGIVDFVGFGTSANGYEGTGPAPAPSNTTSIERKATSASDASSLASGSEINIGNGYDSNNNISDFVAQSTINPQNSLSPIEINPYNVTPANGVGSAMVTPNIWKYNVPTTLSIIIKPENDTIRGFKFVKPQLFSWNSNLITVKPDSIFISQSGDTTKLSHFILKGIDSIIVTILNVIASDTTDTFGFNVQSSKDSLTYFPLRGQPKTTTYSTFRPMSWVKVKDGSGFHIYAGKYVVVKGIVTVANEFGGPTFLQDATAGVAVYDSSVSRNVTEGDEVLLLGVVSPYNEMFELNPCSLLQTISQGNPVDTVPLTISQIKAQPKNGVEPYECRLIRVSNITNVITTNNSQATFWMTNGSGTNYKLISGTDTLEVRISTKTNISNTSIPSSKFDIVGTLGQFTSYYQIMPRSYNDIIVEGTGPRIISDTPYESDMTSTSITFTWQTDTPGSSIVIRGLTTVYTDTVVDKNAVAMHQVVLKGLLPATIYHIKIGSSSGKGTTYTNDFAVSTASRSSLGTINVYFNHSVNTALARSEDAQNVSLVDKILSRINAAKYSIDVALYSLNGTVGTDIAAALVVANNRGVKVRVIGEADNSSTTPWAAFSSNGIANIFDTFDAANAGAGLMHNKLFIIDMRDSTSDTTSWVISGSWNATDPGNIDDAQNVIEIQDKALANAYTAEFNEMWGSNTNTPSTANSRFGAHKLNNTPHYFIINSVPVELYFSPSDGTTNRIIKTVNKAISSINFGIFTFTRSDIANVLIAKKKVGIKIHGVMDNKTDQGSVFDILVASGLDVHLKGSAIAGLFHHKYCVIDAESLNPDQYVITGSHNWSSSAENSNSENTLIIKSQRIANLYLQEFSSRYIEAGGVDALTGVVMIHNAVITKFYLSNNFPNPFNSSTSFEFNLPKAGMVSIKVFDILGREVATLLNETKPGGVYQVTWNASTLPSGVYFYRVQAGNNIAVRKALLLK